MSLTPETIDAMLAAGVTADQVLGIIKAEMLRVRAAEQQAKEERLARGRDSNRERQATFRARRSEARNADNDGNGRNARDGVTPPPKIYNSTPHPEDFPVEPVGSTPRRGSRRPKSDLCPDDFQPNDAHFAKAAERGQDRAFVIATRDRMHRWSHANASRPIARKSDWGMAFHSFLDRALDEAPSPHARHGPPAARPASAQQRAFDLARQADRALTGDPDDPGPFPDDAPARPADGGYSNGHARSGFHEPAGGQFRLAPPRPPGPPRPH